MQQLRIRKISTLYFNNNLKTLIRKVVAVSALVNEWHSADDRGIRRRRHLSVSVSDAPAMTRRQVAGAALH